ncbi:tektin-1-like [Adelges cooleyi]|uniref:tektin-1-like n=1 Tax=Adelges cooleyi TaxID=133065 RepID=UPI00217FB419|nr:tektin-1-like [Adelges cooleyi]
MNCDNYKNVYDRVYHTPAEWCRNNDQQIKAAETQQEWAERLTVEADRQIVQAKDSVVKNKLEIDHQSKVKVKDIEFKRKEIENKKGDLEEEIETLSGYKTRIENANRSLVGDALDVIAECVRLRSQRVGIDLVLDDVEKELLRERQLIVGINERLEDLLDKVVLQLRKLRSFVYNLSVDLQYKHNVLEIEAHNESLNENSVQISVVNSNDIFAPAKISGEEWDRYSLNNITAANKTLVEGRPLRAFFDKCLSKMIDDLHRQSSAVDEALRLRSEEYREMIAKLHQQRARTASKIEQVRETVGKMQNAIADKEAYIALAHTRLKNRTLREGVELCRDELEAKLHAEVAELQGNVRGLRGTMAGSSECLRHLKQSFVRIDTQLEIKNNSLRIDGELCVQQRRRINYRAY